MAFVPKKLNYTGKVRVVRIGGDSGRAFSVGGEDSYPFYLFEGTQPNRPKIAMEVYDSKPGEWPAAVLEPFKDVCHDPVLWARKCVDAYKAELIALQLSSTDPAGEDRAADEAAEAARKVAEAIGVPLIVLGSGNVEKDAEVLRRVCEVCEGKNLTIGPVQEGNYKKIGAGAIAFNHNVIASTPIDINMAKQLNILLGNLGVPDERIIMDPTTGGLGYGIEYTYSIMERDRMAALTQEDVKLQTPILCDLAKEVWKTKEARLGIDEAPTLGDPEKRGILMEAITAVVLLQAGANIVIMRHPRAVDLVREIINDMLEA